MLFQIELNELKELAHLALSSYIAKAIKRNVSSFNFFSDVGSTVP